MKFKGRFRLPDAWNWREQPLLAGLLALFAVQAIASLSWRFVHDGTLLQYAAFLVLEHGKIPYRDLWDINLPGTYLFNFFWIKVFGYSDFGFRLLDLLWLGGILAVIFRIIRRFGEAAAWMAVAVVGLCYISDAPLDSLQREWILALPLLIITWLVIDGKFTLTARGLIAGVVFGFIFLIKPHAVILWPLLLAYEASSHSHEGGNPDKIEQTRLARLDSHLRGNDAAIGFSWNHAVFFTLFTTLGFIAALLPVVWWMTANQAWTGFLDIVKNYYPLHAELSGGHDVVVGVKRYQALVEETLRMGGNVSWVIAAGVGYWLLLTRVTVNREDKRVLALLGGAGVIFTIYPAISGQFWAYHFALMQVFILPLTAATLFHRDTKMIFGQSLFPSILIFTALLFGPRIPVSTDFIHQVIYQQVKPPKYGRVDEMADFLKSHLKLGDKVQPLDWTGGAVQAALIAKADLATSFICDAQFYHHLDSPYIERLRFRFICELEASQPRFILEMTAEDKPWPTGPNTTRDFPALQAFLVDYRIVLEQNGYRIWEKRDRRTDPFYQPMGIDNNHSEQK